MSDDIPTCQGLYGSYGSYEYQVIDKELKWGRRNGKKFDFIYGNKYKVSYLNPQKVKHKNAVGVYIGCRKTRNGYKATLGCLNEKFTVDIESLVPWDGEITKEHLKLISPDKKTHLLLDGRCACKCDTSPGADPPKMKVEDFLNLPENHRCPLCNNHAAKKI